MLPFTIYRLPVITVTLALLLIPYALVVLLYALVSAAALYHLLRFGIAGFSLAVVTIIYTLVSATLLTASFRSFADIDWSTPLELRHSSAAMPFFIDR